jgi:hypothetical protein
MSHSSRWSLATPALILTAVLVGALGPAAASPGAAEKPAQPSLQWDTTTLDGRRVSSFSGTEPLRMSPEHRTKVNLRVTNTGSSPCTVGYVRLAGRVLSMTFFSYSTEIQVEVRPHQTVTRTFDLDLYDLGRQAVGKLPARMELLGTRHQVLDQRTISVLVDGSLSSVYGVFGLAVAGITVVLVTSLLMNLARERLPTNRWRRALRFLPVGTGLGFTATFTLSATGQLTPSATAWATFVVVLSAGAFVLGYFLPGYDEEAESMVGVEQAGNVSRSSDVP